MSNTTDKTKGLEIIRFIQKTFQISDTELIKALTKNRTKTTTAKEKKKSSFKFTEEQFAEFIRQKGCHLCGSQRCRGDLESAKHCKRFLDWLKTGKISK